MILFYSNVAATATTSKTHPSGTSAAAEWKIGSLARDSDSEHSNDDDEFFDCQGNLTPV